MPVLSRKHDIDRMSKKCPPNLQTVHSFLKQSVKEALKKLSALEISFYGKGKTVYHEVKKWAGPLEEAREIAHAPNLRCAKQLDKIISMANDPFTHFIMDKNNLEALTDCYDKIKSYIPNRFGDLTEDLHKIMKYLQTYCLSYYDIHLEPRFDTGYEYECKRQRLSENIRQWLQHIVQLPVIFKETGLDCDLEDFCYPVREISRKCEVFKIPFLFMFPEACESIRNACNEMLEWIQADEQYASFVKNDIIELEASKEKKLKRFLEIQNKSYQLAYRLSTMEMESVVMSEDLDNLKDRENQLICDEELLMTENNTIKVDIEVKGFRRDNLRKNITAAEGEEHQEALIEAYAVLGEELKSLRGKMPQARRKLAGVKLKLEWIERKKEDLENTVLNFGSVKQEMKRVQELLGHAETEYSNCLSNMTIARQIHLYKSSPDALEKIFHGLPVALNFERLPGNMSKEDPFERACSVTSQFIDSDWSKLYRTLPYYPERGCENIERDIRDVSEEISRESEPKRALRMIHRWRRLHTRATLDNLKTALEKLRRFDVLQEIELELNPPKKEKKQEESNIPDFLPEHLVPYFREVERYDQLRASGKLNATV
ncbi:unnamed protein product [Owenia fusiformis]|uniref:Uncharacterized protein n=1 Tax=Owenia fusiformis TaxID=6347 RepID=A0A8J1UQU5_OWEFU|nr:unnamed protein product [Owenia fusiformis]